MHRLVNTYFTHIGKGKGKGETANYSYFFS